MNIADLKNWMDDTGMTREQVAEKLGVPKRTLDNWFSAKEIPLTAQLLLARLIQESSTTAKALSLEQFELLRTGAELSGYASLTEFIFESAIRAAEEATQEASKPSNKVKALAQKAKARVEKKIKASAELEESGLEDLGRASGEQRHPNQGMA